MGRYSTRGVIATFLRSNPTEFTAREVSLNLGISYDTVRKHLNDLVATEAGFTLSLTLADGVGRPTHVFMFVS